jgi:anaerobic selenocysteine-containing dehydrogenase
MELRLATIAKTPTPPAAFLHAVIEEHYMTDIAEVTDNADVSEVSEVAQWQKSACILCECNCGVEIRLGGESGRTFERIRGDKEHPASKGYTCEKALRLDFYQNGRGERLTSPLRRRADGTYEKIDWDTAIREVAARFAAVRDTYGGEATAHCGVWQPSELYCR